MAGIHDQKKIDEMRARLYERGTPPPARTDTTLTDVKEPVSEQFSAPPQPKQARVAEAPHEQITPMAQNRRKKYRRRVLLTGVLFFFGAIVVASVLLLFGNNNISAENISISLNGPFTIGGGETITIQVGVTNANAVPINAATLLINYADGTKSVGEDSRNLYIERIPLESIASGETINIPLSAVIFGEENTEQTILASIEYRVEGSNATFFKEAEPLRYKISSAPVVARVAANQKISSGQETDITVSIISNTPNAIENILVVAEYPDGFDFTASEPSPSRNQNVWQIDRGEPAEESSITIRGVVVGKETDERAMHFSVGVPKEDDPTELASVFNTVTTEFEIEQPFIDVSLELGGEVTEVAVVEPDTTVNGRVTVTNTLSDTIYDTNVTVTLGGNALADPAVAQTDGFYDSSANTIKWDGASSDRLQELRPGESTSVSFSIKPDATTALTPTITLTADVESRRVRENRVPEALTGSVSGVIKVASLPSMVSEARRTSGPVPPQAETETTYTLSILAESNSNSLNDVVVTTELPQFVTFEDVVSEIGTIEYNRNNRTVTWNAGNLDVGSSVVGSFTVTLKPSVNQIGKIVTLMEEQRLRANDAFTGTVVRASKEAVTTELSTELGFEPGNGRVVE